MSARATGNADIERLGYRPALDGMRGVAILFVMAFHSFADVGQGGFIGVDMFFVLSGFLITTLLLEERDRVGRVSLRLFYARRALRLLPALMVLCGVCLAWVLLAPANAATEGTYLGVPSALLYVSNLIAALGHRLGLLEHTWSLSVEEQFYLLWPLALVGMLALSGRKAVLNLCLCVVAGIFAFRMIAFMDSSTLVRTTKLYYLTRADALLVGCSVAVAASLGYVARFPARLARAAAWLGGLILVLVVLFVPRWDSSVMYLGGFTVVAAATGVLIVGLVHHPVPRLVSWLSTPRLVSIGRISYGLYLWHVPIGFVLARQTSLPTVPRALLVWPMSFGAAILSYVLVERPALRFKARLRPAIRSGEGDVDPVVVGFEGAGGKAAARAPAVDAVGPTDPAVAGGVQGRTVDPGAGEVAGVVGEPPVVRVVGGHIGGVGSDAHR